MAVKNTIRFVVPEEKRKEYDLKFIVTKVLFELCEVNKADIYCIQDFPKIGQYDVTFAEYGPCASCVEKIHGKLKKTVLNQIKILCLFFVPSKTITVHMFNPFVDVNLVKAFLSHYCDAIKEVRKLKNEFDIYNGKIAFDVRLKMDLRESDAVRHPPSSFNIAGNRGFLTYYGQPKYCKKYFHFGHFQNECIAEKCCRHCLEAGHQANMCPNPKRCDICLEEGHSAMKCPIYEKEKAKGSGGAEGGHPEGTQGEQPGEAGEKPFDERPKRKKFEGNIPEEEGPDRKGPQAEGMEQKKNEEEGGSMEFQPSTLEGKETSAHGIKKSGQKFRIILEKYFHDKCSFAKLRTMGFAKLKDSDYLVVPESFLAPKEWMDFDKNCDYT